LEVVLGKYPKESDGGTDPVAAKYNFRTWGEEEKRKDIVRE